MSEFLKVFAEKLKGEMHTAESDLLPPVLDRPPLNPKIVAIVKSLESDPLLIEPTVRFINDAIRKMNGAKLSVLYTPEEIEEMKKRL